MQIDYYVDSLDDPNVDEREKAILRMELQAAEGKRQLIMDNPNTQIYCGTFLKVPRRRTRAPGKRAKKRRKSKKKLPSSAENSPADILVSLDPFTPFAALLLVSYEDVHA